MKKTKKTKKLEIKKVTLQNLDDPTLDAMAGGATAKTVCFPKACTITCAFQC